MSACGLLSHPLLPPLPLPPAPPLHVATCLAFCCVPSCNKGMSHPSWLLLSLSRNVVALKVAGRHVTCPLDFVTFSFFKLLILWFCFHSESGSTMVGQQKGLLEALLACVLQVRVFLTDTAWIPHFSSVRSHLEFESEVTAQNDEVKAVVIDRLHVVASIRSAKFIHCICRNIICAQGKQSLDSRWNSILTFTRLSWSAMVLSYFSADQLSFLTRHSSFCSSHRFSTRKRSLIY